MARADVPDRDRRRVPVVEHGLLFLVFGLILISPELLAALAFMYLAARAVADKDYRAQFLDPLLEDLRFTLVARDRYRTATAPG